MHEKQIEHALEAWKVTVQVQQHFNDIGLRIRQMAITILAAALGIAATAFQANTPVIVGSVTTSLATMILAAGVVAWTAFYFVDNVWYHRLLVGAVAHGSQLEKELANHVPGIGLTIDIGLASPYVLFRRFELHSAHKMKAFYGGIAVLLVVLMGATHLASRELQDPSGDSESQAMPQATQSR